MLYTGKGDNGRTGLFGCDQRMSKSSAIVEALGSLDEINSLLGWCKVKAESGRAILVGRKKLSAVLAEVQDSLFSIQAELAGAPKRLSASVLRRTEKLIEAIEAELPPIKSFIVAGGTELAAILDVARTVSRRAERRAVLACLPDRQTTESSAENLRVKLAPSTLAYLNRLSSLLYALARLVNHRAKVMERGPEYK